MSDSFWDRPYVITQAYADISIGISTRGINEAPKYIEKKYLKKVAKIDFKIPAGSRLTWSECGMNAVKEWMENENIYENRVQICDLQIGFTQGYEGSIWVKCFAR